MNETPGTRSIDGPPVRRGGWPGVRDALEYGLLRGVVSLTTALPRRWTRPVGVALGEFVYRCVRIRRRVVEENLTQTLGQFTDRRRVRQLARSVYHQLGTTLVEWGHYRAMDTDELGAQLTFHGLEHLERALALDKGVILATAHFGNWELMAASWSALGHRLQVVAKPQRNPLVDRYLNRTRGDQSGVIFTGGVGIREIIRALKRGEYIGILSDQDAGPDGIFTDFLGRVASVQPGPAIFAVRTGAPIVRVYDVRHADGRHHIYIEPVLLADPAADREAETERLTRAVAASLERFVLRHPDHWYWVHRRWKTRPPAGDADVEEAVGATP